MSVAYRNTRIEPGNGRIRVSCEIENRSEETWRTSEGFAIGYQIFDPASDLLVVDGPRVTPGADVAPGETAQVDLEVVLPAEPGEYRVFVSPLREKKGWFYEEGQEFLLLDAAVDGDGQRVVRTKVLNAEALGWYRFLRTLWRAVRLPPVAIWKNRGLIRSMARRDILARYRGSFGGAAWAVLSPLLLMATYFFVFGIVLQTRFANDPSRSGFVLYFLAGMLPWLALSEPAGRAPWVMLEHRNFIKKLVFPVEILPVNQVASGLVTEGFAILIFLLGLALAGRGVPATALWLPVLLVPQVLFTLGLCWFLAALGVFVRDLGQIIGFLLTLWFFLTPICYPESSLPPEAMAILAKNPVYVLVSAYRAILLEHRAPATMPMIKLWLLSGAVFVAGYGWFHKMRRSFADVI